MAPRAFPLRRVLKIAFTTWTVGTAAINLPPKESIPFTPLFKYRVFCEGFGRLLRSAYTAGTITMDYKFSLSDDSTQEDWNRVHRRSGKALVALAERNGGLYVKVGQGFAAQNHLLNPEYCDEMKKLEDCVTFRPFSEVKKVLEEDMGRRIDEVFEFFDVNPIAAASLAQVHRARTRDTHEEVAVKVQYIDVRDRFKSDMYTMQNMLRAVGYFFPGFDFGKLMHRGEDILLDEMDFTKEARNQRIAGQAFEEHFNGKVISPRLIERLTTERVLTTEFIHGVKVTNLDGLKKLRLSPKDVAALVVDAFAHQMFVTGFLHADPHPGNILVRRHPDGSGKPQVVVLDHGLYVTLKEENRVHLAKLWTAIVTHNTPELEKLCKDIGVEGYNVFASTFLQFPYDVFHPSKKHASKDEVQKTREMALGHMEETTAVLEQLPEEYMLVLRNLTTVRSVNKLLGNPVSRTNRMLSYSVGVSHREELSAVALWWMRAKLWWNEQLTTWALEYAMWKDPAIRELMTDLSALG